MRYVYPCNVFIDEEELKASGKVAFNVEFPDVRGANTGGWSIAEALTLAADCLAVALSMYVQEREDIPLPSALGPSQVLVPVPPIVAAKLALYTAMREQNVKQVALAKKLDLHENAIRRILDPSHRSHISSVERALESVGQQMVVEVRPIAGRKDEVVAVAEHKSPGAANDDFAKLSQSEGRHQLPDYEYALLNAEVDSLEMRPRFQLQVVSAPTYSARAD